MLNSTLVLMVSDHDIVTEETWMDGEMLHATTRSISGITQALESDDWREALRREMVDANRESFDNITRVVAIYNGRSYLVER